MGSQSDIADVLGAIQSGPMVGGACLKNRAMPAALVARRSPTWGVRRWPPSRQSGFDTEAICLPAESDLPGLLPASSSAKEIEAEDAMTITEQQVREAEQYAARQRAELAKLFPVKPAEKDKRS